MYNFTKYIIKDIFSNCKKAIENLKLKIVAYGDDFHRFSLPYNDKLEFEVL